MATKVDQQAYIALIRKMTEELGRPPRLIEFNSAGGNRYWIDKLFNGSFQKLLIAAGVVSGKEGEPEDRLGPLREAKLLKHYKQICSKREQIQGFFRSTLNLEELFERAGNPETLKVSAQPDTHVKYKDVSAVNCYTKFLDWYRPHVHLIMGDFVDCEGISHWPTESLEPRRLIPEMKEARLLLETILQATPETTTRLYLKGNHEHWIEQALANMPELFDGLEDLGIEISLKKLLNLEKYGYELFPLNELLQIGQAHFTHGIYTGIHHAKKHLDTFKTNIYYGHLHDSQSFNATGIEGAMEAATLGCLCRLDAKFLKGKPNNWAHGHGAFEFFRDGSYVRYQVPIINGRSSFGGIVFDGNK